jgi:hypothetical protein
LDNSLVKEIQRVIFNAHPIDERAGAADFEELLYSRLEWVQQKRQRHCETLATATDSMNEERTRKESLKSLEKELGEKRNQVEKDKKDRASLVAKGNAERVKRHGEISDAVFSKRREIDSLRRKSQALQLLKNDVHDFRTRRAIELVEEWKSDRHDAALSNAEWEYFKAEFVGPVDSLLDQRKAQVENEILRITGSSVDLPRNDVKNLEPLIPDGAILGNQKLLLLEQEQARLAGMLEIDAQKTKRYTALSEKIDKAEAAIKRIMLQIERANEADVRIKDLREQRRASYKEIFSSIVEEELELRNLYAPLKRRIESEKGTLSKLSFSVKRMVDLERWAELGEELLDLRKNGAFKGRGSLLAKARVELLPAWESGDAAAAADAMFNFISANEKVLRDHMPDGSDFRTWASQVSDWLYSTSHIQVSYGLQYSGIDIERLSPGTRGIVLLLLYLAIDSEDDRPLIIDQPEENLDPQSVFNELVSCFREAKKRRQIIIVTHNANLVVNTDADQVVVATCHPHQQGQLPVITYESGGLENLAIRQKVCDILEGGERAFKERAKRLRVFF